MFGYLISFISGIYVAQNFKECPDISYWVKYIFKSIQKMEEKKNK
jgi:hypothetical protein